MAGWTTLVQAETLSVGLSRADLVIVDCRISLLDPNAGEHAYLTSHLPGAAYEHLEHDLSDMSPHGDGRHPWSGRLRQLRPQYSPGPLAG